ncbi:hypothetical protein ACFFSY_24435 [Paenibacillus aurantiacus]|uniref:Uncharacterized protein n=1 Tax=Paenibacillus aurantiacus TaxID=1936118 RepID=A0ABV5KWV7_9BACL
MRTISTRCSLVLRISDGFTGRPPSPSAIGVSLLGQTRKPIAKPGGLWVFTDLDGLEVTVIVASAQFIEQKLRIRLDELSSLEPVVPIALLPGPAYPLPTGTTVLEALIRDRAGNLLIDERVDADITLPQTARGRLVAGAAAGMNEIEVMKSGVISPGDWYRISGRDQAASGQLVRILELRDGVRQYRTANPLLAQTTRGDLLLPHMKSATDGRGRLRLVLGQPLPNEAFEIFLSFPDREDQTPIGITLKPSVLNQADICLEV